MQPKRFFSVMCVLELIDKGQSLLWFCTVSPKAESLCKEGTVAQCHMNVNLYTFIFGCFTCLVSMTKMLLYFVE